jgi:hypothetical protein
MAGHLALAWELDWRSWGLAAALVGSFVLLWSLRPIGLNRMVQSLDDGLGLRARLRTSHEVDQPLGGPAFDDNPVVSRLLREAVAITIDVRRRIRLLDFSFWLELQTLIGILALLIGMFMLDTLFLDAPQSELIGLPAAWQEPTPDKVVPPDPRLLPPPAAALAQMPVADAQRLQEGLEALADALRDQAITRGVAEALDRGELSSAAEGLRRLADQLGELSPDAREGLGEALDEAAENMPAGSAGLREALQAGGESLAQDDLGAAAQALEELAEALESLDEGPLEAAQTPTGSQGDGGEAGDGGQDDGSSDQGTEASDAQASEQGETPGSEGEGQGAGSGAGEADGPESEQISEEERLAVEGQPLELDSDAAAEDRLVQPAEPGAESDTDRIDNTPFARESPGASMGDLGPDPLAYPWEKRDVIRRYFTP